jgi:hypothetical protein
MEVVSKGYAIARSDDGDFVLHVAVESDKRGLA